MLAHTAAMHCAHDLSPDKAVAGVPHLLVWLNTTGVQHCLARLYYRVHRIVQLLHCLQVLQIVRRGQPFWYDEA